MATPAASDLMLPAIKLRLSVIIIRPDISKLFPVSCNSNTRLRLELRKVCDQSARKRSEVDAASIQPHPGFPSTRRRSAPALKSTIANLASNTENQRAGLSRNPVLQLESRRFASGPIKAKLADRDLTPMWPEKCVAPGVADSFNTHDRESNHPAGRITQPISNQEP